MRGRRGKAKRGSDRAQIGQIDLGTHLAPPQAGAAAQKPARRRRSRAVLREGKKRSACELVRRLRVIWKARASPGAAVHRERRRPLPGLRAPEDAAVRRVSCVHLISLTLRGRVLRVIGCKRAG